MHLLPSPWLALAALLVSAAALAAAPEPGPGAPPVGAVVVRSWEFDGAQDLAGWGQQHALLKPALSGGSLVTQVTGNDPYLHSPLLTVDAGAAKYMHLRMRASTGSQLKIYWRTAAAPNWTEDQAYTVPLIAGGAMHDYDFRVAHPKWTGTLTQFRFDLEPADCGPGEWAIDSLSLYRLGPKLTATLQAQASAVVLPGDEVSYTAMVTNAGGEALQGVSASLSLPPNMKVVSGNEAREIGSVAVEAQSSWTVKAIAVAAGSAQATVIAHSATPALSSDGCATVTVTRASEPPAPTANGPGFQQLPGGDTFVTNGRIGLLFVKPDFGVSHMRIFRRGDKGWDQVGTTSPMSHVAWQADSGVQEADLCPTSVVPSGNGALLTGTLADEAGASFTYAFTFTFTPGGDQVEAHYALTSSTERRLLLWSGPTVQAGEGSFGAAKADAIFPGLEWLVGTERSSSTLDIAPPDNLRWAPSPLKVTVPTMAVSDGKSLVSLMWDPKEKWDGTHALPAARFASPNWVQGQPNHLMSLTVPSIPDYTLANTTLAEHPYDLRAGLTLSLNARIGVRAGTTSLDAVTDWLKSYGLPAAQPLPRTYDAQVELARKAYMSTVWVDDEGFRHCAGWNPSVAPAHAFMLYLDLMSQGRPASAAPAGSVQAELTRRIAWTADAAGPAGLASGAASHLTGWEFPFYYGHVAESLDTVRDQVYATMGTQQADGSWTFEPATPDQGKLGTEGATDSGLILTPASQLMRWARISGDEAALTAGLNALSRAMAFRVPRAAQVWECPVHSPDILAAARGVQAYLDAYIVTGEQRYLDEAHYWAKAGLPFVYMWGLPDLPVMQYGTIPIFGATAFTLSWLGRPVQWNGLVYAYWLSQLARYDHSFDWSQVARGITESGMQQTMASGPNVGTYPDSWSLETNSPNGPYINPEDVVRNLWVLKGQNPELSTVVLHDSRAVAGRLHITSAAAISDATAIPGAVAIPGAAVVSGRSGAGGGVSISATLTFRPGWPSYTLVAGGARPAAVSVDGKALHGVDMSQLDAAPGGWAYDADSGFLVIKVIHGTSGVDHLTIGYRN